MNMKLPGNIIYVIFLSILSITCNSHNEGQVSIINTLSEPTELKATPHTFGDSIVRVVGAVASISEGYLFFLYYSDSMMLFCDKEFGSVQEFAKKGEGPGEVLWVSGKFGFKLPNGKYGLLDPYKKIIYGFSLDEGLDLAAEIDFKKSSSNFDPANIQVLSKGKYVAPRTDFRFGLVEFDVKDSITKEWPIGYVFTEDDIREEILSMRDISYNSDKNLVGEIYGGLPIVIFHDTDGKVVKKLEFRNIAHPAKADGSLYDCFKGIQLGKESIWILYGDNDIDSKSKIIRMDYNYKVEAVYEIQSASVFCVDEESGLIICVNPNSEEFSVVSYKY